MLQPEISMKLIDASDGRLAALHGDMTGGLLAHEKLLYHRVLRSS